MDCLKLIINFINLTLILINALTPDQLSYFNITMPGASPKVNDAYYCTSHKVVDDTTYLVDFNVHSSMDIAHHILIYGCPRPYYLNLEFWECNTALICAEATEPKIVYAWARNASNFSYPPDVGYQVGPHANVSYIVMQIHYLNALPEGHKDYSYITISHTTQRPKYRAGMYLMMAYGQVIIPHKPVYHVDMACIYKGPVLHPFAFRTHAHTYGRAISGFVVKKASSPGSANAATTWIKLGIGSPQWPQAFYPTTQNVTIYPGDLLVGRCSYDSSNADTTLHMGSTHNDEMCNFYLMYYYADDKGYAPTTPTAKPLVPAMEDENTCVDVNVPYPFWGVPFDTDPRELWVMPPTHSTGHPGGHEGGGAHTYPSPGHFADLSLAYNSKIAIGATPSTQGPPSAGLAPTLPRLRAPWIPGNQVIPSDRPQHSVSFSLRSLQNVRYRVPDEGTFLRRVGVGLPPLVASGDKPYKYHLPFVGPDPSLLYDETTDVARSLLNDGLGTDDMTVGEGVIGSVKLQDWPLPMVDKSVGQVGSVAIPPTAESTGPVVYVFHRGLTNWDASSFMGDVYQFRDKGAIPVDTVLKINTTTGDILTGWGKGIFYMPHGLTLDSQGNMWFTDVALHQVFKYSPLSSDPRGKAPKRLLELGIPFEPGHDSRHFCKPTDVAITETGEFFVSDGYCNSRIMKFSKDGEYVVEWGQASTPSQVVPRSDVMNIPHSLALARIKLRPPPPDDHAPSTTPSASSHDPDLLLLFVADRENGRVVCLEIGGTSVGVGDAAALSPCPVLMTSPGQAGRIYAVKYLADPAWDESGGSGTDIGGSGYLLVLRGGSLSPFDPTTSPAVLIYALGGRGRVTQPLAVVPLTQMTGQYQLTQAHDMTAEFTADGYLDIYIGDIEPRGKKLWKYSFLDPSFDPKLLAERTSRKPSVKKAGVPGPAPLDGRTSDSTGGVAGGGNAPNRTHQGKGTVHELGESPGLKMPTESKRRTFSSSSIVIVLTLGIPILMTLVIVCLMRKRGRKILTTKPFLTATGLNGHGPANRSRLTESRNRRYFDDDDDEDLDDDERLVSSRRSVNRKASRRTSPAGYGDSPGTGIVSRLLGSVSSALRGSRSRAGSGGGGGAAYFNLDAVRAGVAPGGGSGPLGRLGSVLLRGGGTVPAPAFSDDDDAVGTDEEDAVLDLKDYYRRGDSSGPKLPPKKAESQQLVGVPRVAIKQFSALGDVGRVSAAPSASPLVHFINPPDASPNQPADRVLAKTDQISRVTTLIDDDDDEIEEFSLRDPRS